MTRALRSAVSLLRFCVGSRLGTRETIDFTVKNHYQLLSAWAPPDELRQTHTLFSQAVVDQGKPGVGFDCPCIRHIFVGETDEDARREGQAFVEYYMKSPALFRPIGAHERGQMTFGGRARACARSSSSTARAA